MRDPNTNEEEGIRGSRPRAPRVVPLAYSAKDGGAEDAAPPGNLESARGRKAKSAAAVASAAVLALAGLGGLALYRGGWFGSERGAAGAPETAGARPDSSVRLAEGVAATVGGVNIPLAKVDRAVDQRAGAAALSPEDRRAARLEVLETLIEEEALFQRAKKTGLVPTDEEVSQKLRAEMLERGVTDEAFAAHLRKIGQTEEEFRENAKHTLAIARLKENVGATVAPPTDAEVRQYFEANKAQIVVPPGIALADIVVDPKENGGGRDDAVGDEAAEKKAREIEKAIEDGSAFAVLARTRSEDAASAAKDGSVGFFSEAQLESAFPQRVRDLLRGMQAGQVAKPIKGSEGRWHIFQVISKRDAERALSFEEAKEEVARQLVEQRQQEALAALVRSAVAEVTVVNYLARQGS